MQIYITKNTNTAKLANEGRKLAYKLHMMQHDARPSKKYKARASKLGANKKMNIKTLAHSIVLRLLVYIVRLIFLYFLRTLKRES